MDQSWELRHARSVKRLGRNACSSQGHSPAGPSIRVTWDAFDPKLVDEVESRAHWLLHPDPTDERAPHPVKKVTADHQCYRIRRLASALVAATGRDPKSITSIASLVEVESAKAVLTFILAD